MLWWLKIFQRFIASLTKKSIFGGILLFDSFPPLVRFFTIYDIKIHPTTICHFLLNLLVVICSLLLEKCRRKTFFSACTSQLNFVWNGCKKHNFLDWLKNHLSLLWLLSSQNDIDLLSNNKCFFPNLILKIEKWNFSNGLSVVFFVQDKSSSFVAVIFCVVFTCTTLTS